LSDLVPREDPARVESLLRAAEIKASINQSKTLLPPIEIADSHLPNDAWLKSAAEREVERHAVRARYLPRELVSDHGWLVLLDLFISEYDKRSIRLVDAAQRWQVSQATAARQLAALIETNLVIRIFEKVDSGPVTLRLTALGRMYLKRVLALSD
jgi:DNA-binding HxlR family transcriptional regulator